MESLEFLKLFDEGHQFNDYELQKIISDFSCDDIILNKYRWVTSILSHIEVNDRHFFIQWYEGNTETQPNEFPEPLIEVKVIETEKVIRQKITSYISLKDNELVYKEFFNDD